MRLLASARSMVFDEPASGGGWQLRQSTPVSGGLAGVRSLPTAGRLIFPAGTTLEAIESGSRSFALELAEHSQLGEVALADTTTTDISVAPGDTLDLTFGRAASPGAGEDCVFLVRVPGGAIGSRARQPGQRPGSGEVPEAPGLADAPPTSFALHPARPNPFSGETTLQFDLPSAARVRIELFDIQGRRVVRLVDQPMVAGRHTVDWNGRGDSGGRVGAGVYLCRMTAGAFTTERRITLLP